MDLAARYEFRIWANSLEDPRTRLQLLAQSGGTQASKETYLVSSATDKCNMKIRNDLLDIKVLIAVNLGLEQWCPALKTSFPLEASVAASEIFPRLEVEAPHLSAPQFHMDQFLEEVARTVPSIAIVPVCKVRQRFTLGACQAESSSVTINNAVFETIAVESPDPNAALAMVHQLGIDRAANTSYVRQIKRLLNNHEARINTRLAGSN